MGWAIFLVLCAIDLFGAAMEGGGFKRICYLVAAGLVFGVAVWILCK